MVRVQFADQGKSAWCVEAAAELDPDLSERKVPEFLGQRQAQTAGARPTKINASAVNVTRLSVSPKSRMLQPIPAAVET